MEPPGGRLYGAAKPFSEIFSTVRWEEDPEPTGRSLVSLNWTVDRIADWETVCYMAAPCDIPSQGIAEGDRMMNPVTNVLIWATIGVDLPGITRENAAEFYARLRFTERIDGPFLIRAEVDGKRPEGSAAWITPEEIIAHIGLTANVTKKSRAQWLKRFVNDLDRDVQSFETKLSA